MPINKKYPLAVLLDALRAYPLPKRRRITIEYTLMVPSRRCARTCVLSPDPGLLIRVSRIRVS